jgi:hypothetical protein
MLTRFDKVEKLQRARVRRNNAIEIYRPRGHKKPIEVRVASESVWLTAHQMAELFQVDRSGIVRHINNIYRSKELPKSSTCAKNAQVAADGKVRTMDSYNLDMIISVGYRVNSKLGTPFRIWAGEVLKMLKVIINLINKRN